MLGQTNKNKDSINFSKYYIITEMSQMQATQKHNAISINSVQ